MPHIRKALSVSFFLILMISMTSGISQNSNEVKTMAKQSNPMDKFDWFIGTWNMEYTLPELAGSGTGTFKKALDDKYVFFDYSASSPTGETGGAHGIFAWDQKTSTYHY